MPKTRIPSPARSQGAPVTPRRQKPRTRSVGSPARSNASGRLSTVIDQFMESNKDSFALSPLGKTVLNDDTDIEQPRRDSWWKKVDHSRAVSEVLDTDKEAVNNVFDELDIEVLSQEKKNYTMDLLESSDSESICSIVIPQRKLFSQKENLQQNRYREIVNTRESLATQNKTNIADKTATETGPRNLFNKAPKRTKPIFPAALLIFSPDKTANKTKELPAEIKYEARNLFGNRPVTKQKNIFADFILSESEDDISEIQPKLFAFQKNSAPVRHSTARPRESSPTSSITTDIEIDDWHLLPSSTMVEQQIETMLGTTPGKRLSKLSEAKESTVANSKDNIESSEKVSNKSKAINKYVEETPEATQVVNKDVKNNEEIKSIQEKSKKTNQEIVQDTEIDAEVHEEMEFSDHEEEENDQAVQIIKNEIETNEKQINKNYEYEQKVEEIETSEHVIDDRMEDNKQEVDEQEMAEQTIKGHEIEDNKQDMDQGVKDDKQDMDQEIKDDNQETTEHAIEDDQFKNDEQEVDEREIPEQAVDDQETNDNEQEIDDEQVEEEEMVLQMEDEDEIENDDNEIEQEISDYEEQNESQEIKDENQDEENNSQKIHDKSGNNGVDVENDEEDEEIESYNEEEMQNESQNLENDSQEIDDDQVENDNDEQEAEEMERSDEEQDKSREPLNENKEQEIENTSQELQEQSDEENDEEQNESRELLNESKEQEIENTSQQIQKQSDEENDEELNESRELLDESQEKEIKNTSQDTQEQSDEENEADIQNNSSEIEEQSDEEIQEKSQAEIQNESKKLSQAEINNESQERNDIDQEEIQNESEELSDGDQEDNVQDDQEDSEQDDQQDNEQDDQEVGEQETEEPQETESETPNVSYDTTSRNRKKDLKSPEAILHEVTNQTNSFTTKGRNTSIRKTKSIFQTKHSIAPVTESTRLSDGTKNSSAEGSGWDSHRTTRKTLRQTFGRDFTPRKSLRAMVMEKSAKRQTAINEANAAMNLQEAANDIPPEDPEEMDYDDNVENIEESDHELSKRTRQTTLEMYLQKIKKENIERNLKIEEQVKNSFKFSPHRRDFLNRIPPKPIRRTAKPLQIAPKKRLKPSVISLEDLPPELVIDMKYKPPKRYQPSNACWITKRLYKFLESKLEPVYNYKARVRAEKLVEMIYNFVGDTRRERVATPHTVAELEHEMARLGIVRTHFDFYNFCHDYMPLEVKIKVVPDLVNDIPMPRNGLFGDIMDAQ